MRSKYAVNLDKNYKNMGWGLTLCVLVLKSMILLASKLPQNPIFITILSDYPHLKNNKTSFGTRTKTIKTEKDGDNIQFTHFEVRIVFQRRDAELFEAYTIVWERLLSIVRSGGHESQPKRFLRQAQDVSHGFWLRLRSQRSSRICFHSEPKGPDIESKCARIRSKFHPIITYSSFEWSALVGLRLEG